MRQSLNPRTEEFDAVVSQAPGVDRHEVFARCRADAPVFFSDLLNSWVLTRYEDVRGVLEDDRRFASLVDEPGASLQRTFLQMSGREHNKKAGTVARVIRSPRAFTEGLEHAIREISARTADALAIGEPIDFKADYAMWIPLLVITELTAISEAGRFRDWYRLIASGGVASVARPEAREAGLAAVAELREFLTPIIDQRRRRPGKDLVSTLAESSYDGQPLSDEEIVSTVATEAVGFHGVEIGAGERVVVLLASANRDEQQFSEPQSFLMDRFLDHPERQFTTTGQIMSFGAGRHHCTGSRLAAAEMVHAIGEFTRRVAWMQPIGTPPPGEGFMLHSPPSVPMILHPAAAYR